jgi:Transcription elongation factor
MNYTPIYITPDDHAKLRLLVTTALYSNASEALKKLGEELDRAFVLEPEAIPPGVVAMESHVEFEDLDGGEIEAYTISFPERANFEEKRISVLAPIGTALIGCRVGDEVSWSTPGGVRRLKVRSVTSPVEADAAVSVLSSDSGFVAR